MPMPRFRSTCTALLLSDICALFTAFILACTLREATGGNLSFFQYLGLLPGLLLFPLLYTVLGLYPGIMVPPSEELKRLSLGSTLGFLFLSMIMFLGQQGIIYSRSVILLAWMFAMLAVPFFRYATRRRCAARSWWGYPVVLFAPRSAIGPAEKEFASHREQGLYIAESVVLDREEWLPGREPGVSFSHEAKQELEDAMKGLSAKYPKAFAFVLGKGMSNEIRQETVILTGLYFRQVLVHLDTPWIEQATLRVADVPGGQVLTMRQNLLDPTRMRMKRILDLTLCFLGSAVLLLVIPLIALCIRLDSRGPVFFTHKRLGQNGKFIRVVKFRTMVVNAQEVLEQVLAENPDMREEWARDQKLARDPRLTRVGIFLRHTSLDELPQVFNVLKGEMSLVGPRPIVENEIAKYGGAYALYTRVKPGITGLWQVSGRNDVDYARRVQLDEHYVYNWSVWLDIYIIIRTVPALLTGRGAY